MSSPYYGQEATRSPGLVDLSDSDEATQQEVNDSRLSKAIEYLSQEGGDDSPVTFMNRVDRIDQGLIQLLPQQSSHFDTSLYQRLQVMIREVRCDFENAMQGGSPMQECEGQLPKYYTPSADRALHRSQEVVGGSKAATSKARHGHDDTVPYEKEFKYGGPSNEMETWHKNFPASLPFPETMQMAHWESLKIDFDLSESGKQLKADGKVVETNVPFNHPALAQYKNLDQYDSGSRFKLPVASEEVQRYINSAGSTSKLAEVVDAFNKGDREKEIAKDYVPRAFLDKLSVPASQTTPSMIRKAVNTTPIKAGTKAHASGAISTTQVPRSQTPGSQVVQPIVELVDYSDEDEDAPPPQTPTKSPTPQKQPTAQQPRASAISRKLERERQESLKKSPRRQSTVPQNPTVVLPKRAPGRPRKVPAPAPMEDIETGSEDVTDVTPKPSPRKRKTRTADSTYAPTPKRPKTRAVQPKRGAKTLDKAVNFAPPSETPPIVKVTKTTSVTTAVPEKKSLSKAAAAGNQARRRKEKRVCEELVLDEEYQGEVVEVQIEREGPTRSGRKFNKD